MVSYLFIIFGLSLIASGICYNFTSDAVDLSISTISSGYANDIRFSLDSDGVSTGNLLMAIFKFSLVPVLISLIFFSYTMSQKVQKSW